MALCMAVIYGCAEEQGGSIPDENMSHADYPRELGNFNGLSAETEWQILQDCINAYVQPNINLSGLAINDIFIKRYGGTYNDCFVVVIDSLRLFHPDIYRGTYSVEGVIFENYFSISPLVWNNGKFYNIQESYISAWLNEENLHNIVELLNTVYIPYN